MTSPREPDAREAVADEDPQVIEVARAIAEQGFGRPWDDFLPLNAHDTDQGDLIEYARAAVASLRQPAAPGGEVPDREALKMFVAWGLGKFDGNLSAQHQKAMEAGIAALSIPAAPGGKPVAWRWRPRGAVNWIYDPTDQWREEHKDAIETEPLYASPPPSDERAWKCKANPTGVVPSDCDWPGCGCDPHAERVIRGLIECGWEPPSSKPSDERAKVMEEMLNFFTRHYEPWMDNHKDEAECIVHSRHTFGDLRRARAALFPSTPPTESELRQARENLLGSEGLSLSTKSAPPDLSASHNNGERGPSEMSGFDGGADTRSPAATADVRSTEAYRETVRKIAQAREKRLAEVTEDNARLRSELDHARGMVEEARNGFLAIQKATIEGRVCQLQRALDAEPSPSQQITASNPFPRLRALSDRLQDPASRKKEYAASLLSSVREELKEILEQWPQPGE